MENFNMANVSELFEQPHNYGDPSIFQPISANLNAPLSYNSTAPWSKAPGTDYQPNNNSAIPCNHNNKIAPVILNYFNKISRNLQKFDNYLKQDVIDSESWSIENETPNMNLLTCSSALATLSHSTTTAITTTTSSSSSLSSTLSSISSSSSTGKELHPTTTIWPEHGQWNCTGKLNVALGLGPFDNLFDALIAKGHTSHPNGFNHRLANNYNQIIDLKRDEQQQQQPLAFGNYCNSAMIDNEMDYGYYSYNYPCSGAANGYNYIDHDNNTSSINKQNNQSPINFNSVDASSMQFSDQFYFGYNSTYSHSPINQLNFVDDINKYNNSNNNGNYLSADYLTYTNFYYQ